MLGIVKPEDLDALLKRRPVEERKEPPPPRSGGVWGDETKSGESGEKRTSGNHIPPLLRRIIALTAIQDSGHAAERAFSATACGKTASRYINGVDGNGKTKPEFRKQLEASLEAIQAETSSKLLATLGYITSGELSVAELKTKLYAADKLAGVLGKVRERGPMNAMQTNVTIYSPGVKQEVDYDVIDVGG